MRNGGWQIHVQSMKDVFLKWALRWTALYVLVFGGVGGTASVRGDSVITFNEIMYNPANDAQELEFVELYNALSYNMDISLWKLVGGIDYTFPVGTTIPSEGFLVIAKSPSALEAAAGISGVLGPLSGQLANGGESIRLENNSGRVMDEVEYGDGGKWPVGPDGSGASLAKINLFTPSATAANWRPGKAGGTPGSDNSDNEGIDLVINEIAGVTNSSWWIELRNDSGSALNLTGYVVSVGGDPARQYTLPSSSMPAGGFLLLTAAQLGFTALDEEPIFLYRPGLESVADARVAKRSLRGRSGNVWLNPSVPTPGYTNVFSFNNDIVINEIMYHHQPTNTGSSFAASDVEWIELYNRGAGPVNMSGWKFDDGIGYDFPAGTMLASGGYLVVSNFSGTLANGGERILLLDAAGNPADEVHYFDGGRWPQWADGRGSSLELRNPFANNNAPEAWAASNEGLQSGWNDYSYQVAASASAAGPDSQWRDFVLGLLDAGEVLLDDISVIEDPGDANTELISTRDFESGVGQWRIIGTHRYSEVIVDPDNAANHVLRLVATDGASEHMHNHAEITLANGQSVDNGKTYRIFYRAKWIGGSRLLNTRLYFNRTAKTQVLQVPMNNGTPAAQNSTYEANIGPTFDRMLHNPAVPNSGAPTTVSVHLEDPQGIASALVRYSVAGGIWQQVVMTNTGGGRYAATLPGQPAASLVQFYVEAQDGLGAVSAFPSAGTNSGALYMVNDGLSDPLLHNFRIILTQANANWMEADINYMSNDPIPATVIFRDSDIYYDVGVRFKGSLFGRHADQKAGFRVGFNADQLFNGVLDNVSVDRSALVNFSRMPETLIHMAMNRCGGVMTKYSDLIKVIVPISGHSNPAQLQLGHYSDVFLDGQFENGGDGDLFEYEYIYYPTATNSQGYKEYDGGGTLRPPIQDFGNDKENYRHSFLIKNNRARDDYSGLINFARVMSMTGSAFNIQIEGVVDVDQWLRYFAYGIATGNNDNFSRGSDHNAVFYRRPSDGRFLYFTHDLDHTQSTPALVSGNDYLQKMIAARPGWERLYYSHMRDILVTAWNTNFMRTYTDQFSALIPGASGNFTGFLNLIGNYHNVLAAELATKVAPASPFAVTSGGQTVNTLSATVTGDAWLDVYNIYLKGQDTPLLLTWTASGSGATRKYSWSATIPLNPGTNMPTFLAYDYRGYLVGSNTVLITTTATGNPLQDHLRVTELMVNPTGGSDYEFLELRNTGSQAINLSGVHFSQGISFDFSAAGFTNLSPGEYCVMVADLAAFTSRYGTTGITIAGVYSGKLANEGETIEILGALNEEILRFTYGSGRGWPLAAEVAGHALVPLDSAIAGERAGSLYYGGNWRAGNLIGGSPGQPETSLAPTVQLNEIVAHTDYDNPSYPQYDSNDQIELYNPSSTNLVLGTNWHLSDDASQLDKWAIPAVTTIASHGHVAFDEVTGFHSPITNGFGLDKAGEQVFLSYLPPTGSRRVVDAVRFKGQENGVALGRYADGDAFWYALAPTAGSTNVMPELHLVVSEFMFHPPDNPTNNTIDEFLEIHNPSAVSVDLWNASGGWRIDGGVGYTFPSNTTLAAGGSLVLVTFNPTNSGLLAGFLATYGLTNGEITVMGPLADQLDNRGERIAIERPQAGDLPGQPVSWVIVDEVIYFHQSPWPTGADGTGRSLQRKHTRWSGNDPNCWYASFAPSPGTIAEFYGTHGVPDWWLAEKVPGTTNNFALAAINDPDGDGMTTEQEYVAGTEPVISASCLRLETAPGAVSFPTVKAGYEYNGRQRWYSLRFTPALNSGGFNPVPGFVNIPADGGTQVFPIPAAGYNAAYYRLETELR